MSEQNKKIEIPAHDVPKTDESDPLPKPSDGSPVDWILHVHNRLHRVLSPCQDLLESRQQLMAGYDQFDASLNQAMNNSLLPKIGVDSDHGEALPEVSIFSHWGHNFQGEAMGLI